jgi:AcrR family transcriptional regulator
MQVNYLLAMTDSLRARKKQAARERMGAAARRLFLERGYNATTVEDICAEADVSVATFFRYFETKEAVAFPDEDYRVDVALSIIRDAPQHEPLHVTVRRSTLAMVDLELLAGESAVQMHRLIAREPLLAAHAQRRGSQAAMQFTAAVGERLRLDPATDVRPGVVVGSVFAALGTAWAMWLSSDQRLDLRALVEAAHDALDCGLDRLQQPN